MDKAQKELIKSYYHARTIAVGNDKHGLNTYEKLFLAKRGDFEYDELFYASVQLY